VLDEGEVAVDAPEFREYLNRLLPREARWRYFQKGNGPMFIWTVEPFSTRYGSKADGKYESVVYVPYGPGSRSGKATRWKRDPDSASLHVLRRDAKARALRLYREWAQQEGGS
jgi:hypothetical protein